MLLHKNSENTIIVYTRELFDKKNKKSVTT